MLSNLTLPAAPACKRRRPTLHNDPLNIRIAPTPRSVSLGTSESHRSCFRRCRRGNAVLPGRGSWNPASDKRLRLPVGDLNGRADLGKVRSVLWRRFAARHSSRVEDRLGWLNT